MAKKIRMADIAAELNISTVTVSKALANQKGVSEELRDKIKKLAEQLEYKQPSLGKNENRRKCYNIGVISQSQYVGRYASFYWHIYLELAKVAVQRDCFTMMELICSEDENRQILPKLIQEKRADGIILLGRPSADYMRSIKAEFTGPMICLDFYESEDSLSIISDGYYGTYMLTNYLFQMGHEDIAYVGNVLYTNSITDRYFGYSKSMLEHGKKLKEEWILDDRDWKTGDVNEFTIKLPDRLPTAFVCNSDFTAGILIRLLKEKGYRVPEDISVTGFDNYPCPGFCDIGITTYEVNIKEMAGRSINELLELLRTQVNKKSVIIIEGKVVYKDSVQDRRLNQHT